MNLFTLHFTDDKPLYEQLYTYIKDEIENENISAHEKLPSKRRISKHLNISQNTVESAYNQLLDEGYIYSKERSGYFVEEIDWMKPIKTKSCIIDNNKKDRKKYKYDFTYSGIDAINFPIKDYQKMYRKSLKETNIFKNLGDPQGYFPLRKSITKYLLSSRGVDVSPDDIVISAGTEYLFNILFKILPKNTTYGIENPGYERFDILYKYNNLKYKPIDIYKDGIKVSDLNNKKINCMTITPSHQFPTGILYPMQKRQELLAWAYEEKNRWIIEDDYDSEFRYSGKPIPALKGFDVKDRVIYIGSFSKSFSPALRISYMILPKSLKREYQDMISSMICPVPTLTQDVFHRFMDEGYFSKHLNRMRTHYANKREILLRELNKIDLPFNIDDTDAGLHLVMSFNKNITEDNLVNVALEEDCKVYGISNYYSEIPKNKKHTSLLIGYGAIPIEDIKPGVARLKKAWDKLN